MTNARVVLAGVACAWILGPAWPAHAEIGAPSEAVYPPQELRLRFSHRRHLALKLACDFCHDRAPTSTSAADRLVPTEEACRTCHRIDRAAPTRAATPAARCDACHPGFDPARAALPAPSTIPAPNLKFNHRLHADRGIGCARCHDVAAVDLATRAQLPRMSLCLECHDAPGRRAVGALRAPGRCTTCHPGRADGTVETRFPSGRLVPSGVLRGDDHGPRFAVEHARSARPDEGYCQACHRRSECLACHAGAIKPHRIHPSDYVALHAVDARKAALDCQACHRLQSFCRACHERTGVVDPATARAPNGIGIAGRRFHPPYERWVQPPRTPEHHGWQAERNLRQCVSCHREDTCLQCHSARGEGQPFRVNPHPVGFAGSRECRAIASRNARVCLKCHAPGDAQIGCER